MNKKKNKSFEDRAKAFLIFVVGAYIIGWLGVKSVESSSNREQQVVEGEVEQLQNDIAGLELQKQDLTSFARVNQVASQQGYTYTHNDVTAYLSNQ